jgi:molecular chaperone HtpG
MKESITFQVDTARVLQILAKEIYDSPLALLRENVQNAYDAIRMRMINRGIPIADGKISISVEGNIITITDNGVGMTESVLRDNFWKAGSSGKHSKEARAAGVVGTFGIGAMANFGVCTQLSVVTKSLADNRVLVSVANRDDLRINEECIQLSDSDIDREVGTTVKAIIDSQHLISASAARTYLEPYVATLPVAVYFNGQLISQRSFDESLGTQVRNFSSIGTKTASDGQFTAAFGVEVDKSGQVLVRVSEIHVSGSVVDGSLLLLQSGGQLMGLRSYFGLSPIPVAGHYAFGGMANLATLQPTAGREAVSRESIDQLNRLVSLAERVASEVLSESSFADKNNALLHWIVANGRYELAKNITVQMYPDDQAIKLSEVATKINGRTAYCYSGQDGQILNTFANEASYVLHVSQARPRRAVQQYYLRNLKGIPEVPDSPQILTVYSPQDLSAAEAAVAIRTAAILRDDYLVSNIDVKLAEISHGVAVLPESKGDSLLVYISRSSMLLPPVLKCYTASWELFGAFMKDFVRAHVYKRVQQYVPSSTRDGVDALRKILERSRELYRYEESEFGELESVLGEYLSGSVSMTEVLKTATSVSRAQSQSVSREQVGTVESELADVINSPISTSLGEGEEYLPAPPYLREELDTDLKMLMTNEKYPQLNGFSLLLGLSDRLFNSEADFFRTPHTTRIIWGGHRVVYIFTEVTGRISLYYDVELKDPIDANKASGGMFPTTTVVTKKRIFVPVPDPIADAFKILTGPREFFVRFDVLYSDMAR